MALNRRKFLKFAGVTGALELLDGLLHPALAGTWTQIGTAATGATGTWRLISPIQIPTPLKASVAAGGGAFGGHSVTLRSDGAVFSSGYNNDGQLGNNSVTSARTLVQAIGISNAVAISAGAYQTMALRSDGLVFGSGGNFLGGLGIGSTTNQSTFIQATGISNAVAIAAGGAHNVAIRSDGLVFASGENVYGQLGTNSTTNQSTFIQAIGISGAVTIACGYSHSVALRSDGLVFSSGYNNDGQLGINTTGIGASCSTFVQATGISNAIAIAAGGCQTLALRSDGLVFASGSNTYGQLGVNSGSNESTFIQATGISNAIAIACGYNHTIALRSDGLVFAAGLNNKGQLGINSTTGQSAFVQATGISNAIAIAAGGGFFGAQTLALRSDGTVFSTGYDGYGQLDLNSTTNQSTFVQAL